MMSKVSLTLYEEDVRDIILALSLLRRIHTVASTDETKFNLPGWYEVQSNKAAKIKELEETWQKLLDEEMN